MKRIFLIITILAPLFTIAQTEHDMFEFSAIYYNGTAKSTAMGNAMGAVGSDFSAIAINPAGLGLFRKSTFLFSPSFYATSTESNYKGSNGIDRTFHAPLNNVGITWTQEMNEGALNSISFSLGINHLNNFSYNSLVNGDNMNTSLLDAYLTEMDMNGINNISALSNYSTNMYSLYETDVMVYDDDNHEFVPLVPQGNLNQQYGVSKTGGTHEFSFATGFNFEDKWFLGVSLNIPYFEREVTTEYKERNLANDYFKYWDQEEYISNVGRGVNAKLGVIVYPAKWLRIGAAFHSPTFYKIDETWYTDTYALFEDGSEFFTTPNSTYSYTITTPYRLNASTALIFGNYGMLTADYEFVDYSKMKASSYDYNYSYFNNYIKSLYGPTSNIRVGGEWRWQSLCFRAGYAFYGSPYGLDKTDLSTNSYSCGLGFTHHRFTIDAAYVFSQRKNTYDLYSQYSMYPAYYQDSDGEWVVDNTKVKETTNMNQVVISLKFRLD